MNYIQSIAFIVMPVLLMSCNNHKGDDSQTGGGDSSGHPKAFATAAEAANAGKADMLAAMDKNVAFGVDKEKLRAANPGNPITRSDVSWDALLKADSTTDLEKITTEGNTTIVPLVNGNEIVTVIGMNNADKKFRVSMLGEKRLSTELDAVNKAAATPRGQNVAIFEIPNLQATVYKVINEVGVAMYYTSYNNSLRQGTTAGILIGLLRADATAFERAYGDKIKKNPNKLAR